MKSHVALIGMMAAGKSTIGRRLARDLGMPFFDTDELVVAAARRSIAHIFAHEGEARFRVREFRALEEALRSEPAVVSVGGGAVTHPATRELLARAAVRVYVHVEPRIALGRLRRSRVARPLLGCAPTMERFMELLAAREPLYREAELTVSGAPHAARVARDIVRSLSALRAPSPVSLL